MTAPTAPDPTPGDASAVATDPADPLAHEVFAVIEADPDASLAIDPPTDPESPEPSRAKAAAMVTLRWVLAIGAALVIFGAFLLAKGSNPVDVYQTMWQSIAGDTNSMGELLVQSAPFLLAALAVAVPARAGLFNIGGEGQLLLGGIGAVWMSQILGNQYSPMIQLTLMALAGAAFGAFWALIPALLKLWTFTSEAITSLLLNYVSALILAYLVHGAWKDPKSFGFPQTTPLELDERWPIIWGNRVHAGIVISVIMAIVVWAVLKYTPWGFRVRVVGGNAEAARRAGFRVGAITVGAMVFGGALAGLAGMIEVTGVEGQARPGMMVGYGFIGFLASWLVKHDPLKIIGSAILLGAIAVGGNGLKLSAGVSGASVYILMSLILLAVLGWTQVKKKPA
jgi:ABC-type uncharacterized transport system permease subunit